MCDSCYEEYGPKDSQRSSASNSPLKTKKPSSKMESDLPAEYLASSLAQQVSIYFLRFCWIDTKTNWESDWYTLMALGHDLGERKAPQKGLCLFLQFLFYSRQSSMT